MTAYELAFDVPLVSTVRVKIEASSFRDAVEMSERIIRAELDALDIGRTITTSHPYASQVTITEASPDDRVPFAVFEANGEPV